MVRWKLLPACGSDHPAEFFIESLNLYDFFMEIIKGFSVASAPWYKLG